MVRAIVAAQGVPMRVLGEMLGHRGPQDDARLRRSRTGPARGGVVEQAFRSPTPGPMALEQRATQQWS